MRMIYLNVWGDMACFTRPELSVERVSYLTITPSASRGILQAIHWKPQMRWHIHELYTLLPPKFQSIKRNEVSKFASKRIPYIDTIKSRQQRSSLVLKDVEYVIAASIESKEETKHYEIFTRRAQKGQCFYNPYLGCREFPAYFKLIESPLPSKLNGVWDLGLMFFDYDYDNETEAKFFRAIIVDGRMKVPSRKEVFNI